MPTPDLDLTICVLELLIERYGINRSLSNVLDSERSIRNEQRKRVSRTTDEVVVE